MGAALSLKSIWRVSVVANKEVPIEPVAAAPLPAEGGAVVPLAPDDEVAAEAAKPSVGERLLALFQELQIRKIVVVDDELQKPLDAALITRILDNVPDAVHAVSPYFPNVDLSEANTNRFEQVTALLEPLEGNARDALSAALSVISPEAADINIPQAVSDLAPADFPIDYLTPAQWAERREALLTACTVNARTLFLFDQDLDSDAALGSTKGTQIIAALADQDRAAFGMRWFCGILSHTLDRGTEVSTWRELAAKEELSLELFMPISKQNLRDGDAFYGAVYRTVINIYTEKMKSIATGAFDRALEGALVEFKNLDPIDFEHMIVKSSGEEGVSELETLLRLYSIVQKDRVKNEILQRQSLSSFLTAARTVQKVVDVARALPEEASKRLAKLRFGELYETGELINSFRDPLRNGDLFEVGGSRSLKLWVLIGQPCDLMVRKKGDRAYEENFKVAVLAPVKKGLLGEPPAIKPGLGFMLERFDHGGLQSAFVSFADATPVDLKVLDLAVLRPDGKCEINALASEAFEGFASIAWDERAKRLKKGYKSVATKIEATRTANGDDRATELAGYLLPPVAPATAFRNFGSYEKGSFVYKVRRCGRVREPFATSLLAAFSRYMSRDAHEHDFSAVRLD
ncbi:hypothetical protein [Mesorhizobium sangaii]|uniref:Uncharacterized protein n=1 Tax=Mesorhizobium sangaii TaxID=505389 RepID=A0A841PIB8_9HYPH|nr:hypothetical protein [Mesorhizobium sangaii]MBB6413711.1 hypothetical protein [Mesorhizobium sangaii]